MNISSPITQQQEVDVLVIGSGYGGLCSALSLTESGASVVLCEMVKYPGGCASTFTKDDFQFEAGATLFSGFHDTGIFTKWIQKYNLPVQFTLLDPIIEFKTPEFSIAISPDRSKTVERFCALPNAPQKELRAFFQYQESVADTLWPLFDDAERLPPFSTQGVYWHLQRSLKYPKLLPILNRSLLSILQKYKLDDYQPLVDYCNAICQITIQTDINQAEALFALSAMDYVFRGTGHILEGIGSLSWALTEEIQAQGGKVFLSNRVKSLHFEKDHWIVKTRKGCFKARYVVSNLLPQNTAKLVANLPPPPKVTHLEKQLQQGWSAAMLYLVIEDHPSLPEAPHHYQCTGSEASVFQEGHHIFCSLSGRNEQKKSSSTIRTATVSTHIPMPHFTSLEDSEQESYISSVQERMKQTLEERIPEISRQILKIYPASPRTFQRFTNRSQGLVGGIPRKKGWQNYTNLFASPLYPQLYSVGDTSFPGQSTLATALGGLRIARILQSRGLSTSLV